MLPQTKNLGVGVTQIRVLAGFEVRVQGKRIAVPTNAARTLAFLAITGCPQTRHAVAGALWGDGPDERAAANLRTALWRTRVLLGDCVEIGRCNLSISDSVEVDLRLLEERSRRLLDPDAELQPQDCDPRCLSSDLLPGWDEEWILFERERLHQLRIHALEAMSRRLASAGKTANAVDAGLTAVAADPLRETAQHVLIAAHLLEGNVSEARRQFHAYRELLWESIQVEPSEQLLYLIGAPKRAS